jgi:hypothetical protein
MVSGLYLFRRNRRNLTRDGLVTIQKRRRRDTELGPGQRPHLCV